MRRRDISETPSKSKGSRFAVSASRCPQVPAAEGASGRARTLDTVNLSARDRRALGEFGSRLQAQLGSDLLELRLYGAKARGEALDDAELEVAVVVTVVRGEVEEQVVRAAFDVDVAHDVHVSPRVLTPERLTDPAWRMTGFIREIERDGISFQRHRAPVNIVH